MGPIIREQLAHIAAAGTAISGLATRISTAVRECCIPMSDRLKEKQLDKQLAKIDQKIDRDLTAKYMNFNAESRNAVEGSSLKITLSEGNEKFFDLTGKLEKARNGTFSDRFKTNIENKTDALNAKKEALGNLERAWKDAKLEDLDYNI